MECIQNGLLCHSCASVAFACWSSSNPGLCYKPEGRGFETWWCELFFSIYLIPPAALGPVVCWSSNRNEYQRQIKIFLGSRGLCVRLRAIPPFVSRFSTQCGILYISKLFRLPRTVTEIALLFICIIFVPNRKHTAALTASYGDSFNLCGWSYLTINTAAPTACYGDSFTFLPLVRSTKILSGSLSLLSSWFVAWLDLQSWI
jgi:hypothetical protein